MWTSVALVAALSLAPAQAGDLKLTNIRPTLWTMGAPRADNKIVPGDTWAITFDIEGLKFDAEGKAVYSMGIELVNPQGQTEYKKDPEDRPITFFNILGGNRIPSFAHATTSPETPPGEYTFKVTVVDRATKSKQTLTSKFEVQKKTFGLVETSLSFDDRGALPTPPVGPAGQRVFLNFWASGFERSKGFPKITFEMNVQDSAGKSTLPQPILGEISEKYFQEKIGDDVTRLPMQFLIPLSRVGKFTITLKATDQIAKKTATLSFPLEVFEMKAGAR